MSGITIMAGMAIIAGVVLAVASWRLIAQSAATRAAQSTAGSSTVLPWLGLAAGALILGFGLFGAVQASQGAAGGEKAACTTG